MSAKRRSARAGRNALGAFSLAVTSAEVVRARLSNPTAGEAARMMPEKMLAAGSAGLALMMAAFRAAGSFQAALIRESFEAAALGCKLAAVPPLRAMQLQQEAVHGAMQRAAGVMAAAADDALRTQADMVRPFAAAARSNARRLRAR